MDKIRLLIVDDQVLFLESLSTFLRNYAEDIEVVGLARNGREALEKAAALRPDIVLMDVHMPVMDGVEATGRLIEARPGSGSSSSPPTTRTSTCARRSSWARRAIC